MIYNQISGLFHSAEFVPFIGTGGLSKKEDAEQKLKEHESVNRQMSRRLEETAVICTSDFNIGTYTPTCVRHAREIAVPVSVNGEASEILGCSYCNVSRRLLKSADGGEWEVFFFPRQGEKGRISPRFSNRDHFSDRRSYWLCFFLTRRPISKLILPPTTP